jgi:hypothetical protein
MKKTALLSSLLLAAPFIAFAQATTGNNLSSLIAMAGNILNSLIPLLIALAVVVFFWGLVQYVLKSGGEGGGNGRSIMIAGLVALFVMVSVWGIVRLAQNTLGVSGGQAPEVPLVPQVR